MSIYTEEAEKRFKEIAVRVGHQPGFRRVPGFDLFNLTCDMGEYGKGFTLRKETIMQLIQKEKEG
jgi:hypothetical protein